MCDVSDKPSCAVPAAFLDMTDRPNHRILVEYNHIEIAHSECSLEVPRVLACTESRGNERQWTSQSKNVRIRPARRNTPLDPTLERFCGLQGWGGDAGEPH